MTVRGFWGGWVKEYIESSKPSFAIGEYWDSLAYENGQVCYNQGAAVFGTRYIEPTSRLWSLAKICLRV